MTDGDFRSRALVPAGAGPTTSRTARLRTLVATLAVLGMVATACGRSDDDPTASGDDATGEPTESTAPPTSPAGPAAGEFGDLGQVCGPAPAGATLTASDTGVTETSIQVGTIADPGFAGRPGLNQELFDSAEAFTKWCNDAGGINGREIDLKERDSKFTEHQARIIDACDEGDFMLVGGLGVIDDQGQSERLACGLPSISSATNPAAVEADLAIMPVPSDLGSLSIGDLHWLAEKFPEATQKIGFLTASMAVTITSAAKTKEAMAALGWEIVYDEQFNAAGEASWRGYVEGLKSAGVRGVIWGADPTNLAAVLNAMAEIEYHPDFVRAGGNSYDPVLIAEAGKAADGTYLMASNYPFLDPDIAKENLATQQYLDIMAEYSPGGKIANLGVQGFSAWLLFAKAATACGADLTRDCVWESADAIPDWTGGGLHARQDLANGRASQCFVEIEVKDGEFMLSDIPTNEGVFNCDPKNSIDLEGDFGEGAKCENPAFATDPKPSNCAV